MKKRKTISIAALIFAVLATSRLTFCQTTQPAQTPAFIIGVWQQPVENFAAWKSRGVNALVEIPTPASTHPPGQWVAAAEAAGLWQIRVPVGALAADDATPHLLAWNQPDEPDGAGAGGAAATCAANYAAWKAVDPKRPVFLNFDGSRVLGIQGGLTKTSYLPYLACADYICSDIYPVTCWGRPDWIDHPGLAVTTLANWTANKPQFAFIECSNQRIGPSLTATTAQIRYEAWHSVICGATGIVWFPQQFNGFNLDGTTPAIQAEITTLDAGLAAVGPYLAGAKPLGVAAGFECITNAANGNFTLLVNATDTVANYAGVSITPYGAYAIANGKVIVRTPLPPSPDQLLDRIANDEASLAAAGGGSSASITMLQAQVARLQWQMSGIGAATTLP